MIDFVRWRLIAACISGAAVLPACVQMPTEQQSVSDLRPQVSFEVHDADLGAALVFIDGLPAGSVGQYLRGVAALRVLPGSHDLVVSQGGRTVLSERFYVADGVHKTFSVK